MSGYNLPPGVTQRDIDNAAGSDESEDQLGVEECAQCKRQMEEGYSDIWYIEGERMGHEPIRTLKGEYVCSQRCKSQHIFDSLSIADKEVLQDMARAAYAWFLGTEGCGLQWKLEHSKIAPLVDGLTVTAVDTEIRDLLIKLAGEDFVDGKDDGPKWFQLATGIDRKPLEMVKP